MLDIECLVGGPLGNNTYILKQQDNDQVVVVDPADAEQILAYLNSTRDSVALILLTHGHFDHIRGLDRLRKETKAPVAIMTSDADMLIDPEKNLSMIIEQRAIQTDPADRLLTDGESIDVADMNIQVISTPGHTKGGACFLCEHVLISGDTLFHHGSGRTDLPEGSSDELRASFQKLFSLTDDYKVFPGHGSSTTLNQERRNNPFWLGQY